jgi:hypothetical protein
MFWLIGVATTYLLIGLGLAWALTLAGGKKFTLNKQSLPFIVKWPMLIWTMIEMNMK